jgi:hypothetical protein
MSRPKGSTNKNKVKEVVKVEDKQVEDVKQSPVYVPKPDMGNIRPLSDNRCNCSHEKETHYGGEKGHCNKTGCACLEFK